jgi:hypothetical protein
MEYHVGVLPPVQKRPKNEEWLRMAWPATRLTEDHRIMLVRIANQMDKPMTQVLAESVETHYRALKANGRIKEATTTGEPLRLLAPDIGVAQTSVQEQNTDMEIGPLIDAVEKLTAELSAIRQAIDETRTDIQWGIRNSKDYLSAIADATEEIRGEMQAYIRNQEVGEPRMNGRKRQSALF